MLAAVDEVLAYFPAAKRCLKTALDMLTKLSVKELPDAFGMPSLCAQYIRTGDVIYCPCGYVAVEKCIQDTSVAVRLVRLSFCSCSFQLFVIHYLQFYYIIQIINITLCSSVQVGICNIEFVLLTFVQVCP